MSPLQRGAAVVSHLVAVVALTFGLVAGALAGAGAAWAHAARIGGDPADNAELTQPPSRVSATFNEPMQAQFAAMTVIAPDGSQWSDGQLSVDGAVISVGVRGGAPAGVYTVNYRATSADGHVVSGSWSYRVLADATGAAPPPTTPAPDTATDAPPAPGSATDGPPVWPFAAAASAIVALGAIWAVRRRS